MVIEGVRAEDIRLGFEQKVLPLQLYFMGKKWIEEIKEVPGKVYDCLDDLYHMVGMSCPYNRRDFDVNSYTESDGTEIVEIMLPEPTMDMMCRCIYFVHDPDFRQVSYYTYELSYGEYYLTEWKVNPIFMNDDSLAMKAINSRRAARETMLADYHRKFAGRNTSNNDLLNVCCDF